MELTPDSKVSSIYFSIVFRIFSLSMVSGRYDFPPLVMVNDLIIDRIL